MSQGSSHKCNIGFQSNFDTVATTMFQVPFIPTFTLQQQQGLIQSPVIAEGRNPQRPTRDRKISDASIVVPLESDAIGYWLKAVLGVASAPVDNLDGTYTHTFTATDGVLPSLTIEKAKTDLGTFERGIGFKVDTFSFNFGTAETTPQASLGFMGKLVTDEATEVATPTVVNGTPFELQDIAIEGMGSVAVENGSLSFTNNNSDQFKLPSTRGTTTGGERSDISSGTIGLDLTMTVYHDANDTTSADAINEVIKSITIPFFDGTNTLEFIMEEVLLAPNTGTPTSSGGVVMRDVQAIGFLDTGANGSAVTAKLTNARSTAY